MSHPLLDPSCKTLSRTAAWWLQRSQLAGRLLELKEQQSKHKMFNDSPSFEQPIGDQSNTVSAVIMNIVLAVLTMDISVDCFCVHEGGRACTMHSQPPIWSAAPTAPSTRLVCGVCGEMAIRASMSIHIDV